jgi:hypothetical protein
MNPSLAFSCVSVEIVPEVPENLPLSPCPPTLHYLQLVLMSVVFTRRVLCTEESSASNASAQFSHGNRPEKTTALFINIAWEQYCNFADKDWLFYDGQMVLVIS